MIDKSIFNIDYTGKKILLRIDISCSIYENKIIDIYQLTLNLPFIKLLLQNGCSIIIISNNYGNSLALVADKLKELIPDYHVDFSNENIGDLVAQKCVNLNNEVLVLENIELNINDELINEELINFWSSLCDYYVFDALNQAHKKNNSSYGMMKYFSNKCFYGQLVSEEFAAIEKIFNNNMGFSFIIGGAKLSNKINIINKYFNKINKLLIGGALSFVFLKAINYDIGNSYLDHKDESDVVNVTRIVKNKIILPKDFVCAKDLNDNDTINISIYDGLKENIGCDIGNETIDLYKNLLTNAKNIAFFGSLGMFEFDRYAKGTIAILTLLKELTKQGINTYIMSPDLIMCAKANGFINADFTCLSSAENNIIDILQGSQLPGLLLL